MFNLKKGELCPACQKGKLDEVKKELTFTYKKKKKDFQNVKVFKCELCDYEGLTKTANKNIEKELTDFRRSIDGLLTSDELRRIREMLGLNKKNMAWLLHVNAKTVGRYENGIITQSHQIDRLYRVFYNFPSAIRMFLDDTLGLGLSIDPKFHPISSNQTSMSSKGKMSATINNTYFRSYEDHLSATTSI
jgi:putative zinc finger/helix-turn-helix YgiT family protein